MMIIFKRSVDIWEGKKFVETEMTSYIFHK